MINNPDIKEKGTILLKYAMHYGMILGLFWIFKYLFLIGSGFSDHVFIYLYYVLNAGTFLLIYIFTFRFKESDPERPKGILSCALFVTLICFFASFFEIAIMYAHYQFIHPEYFAKISQPVVDMVNNFYPPQYQAIVLDFIKPIFLLSQIISNTFFGFFFGLLLGWLVNTKRF